MTAILIALGLLAMIVMAAPTPTARTSPTGKILENGHVSKITFARDANVNLWEIDVGQPAMDGGEPVDTTTQHNSQWRTRSPRTLIDLAPFTVTFGYDPIIREEALNNLLNQRDTITIRYPDGSTLAFYGYLKSLTFDPLSEGEFPTGTAEIVPTNWDPTNDVEAAPVLTLVSGT
jgi:hypothetical protein